MANSYKIRDAVDAINKALIDDFNLSPALVYMADIVNLNAIPYLANQFDVDGLSGLNLATDEQKQRELIKNAIFLKSKAGTPYGIKLALKTIGFLNVEIVEGVATGGEWIDFDVDIIIPDTDAIDDQTVIDVTNLINKYKRDISRLNTLTFSEIPGVGFMAVGSTFIVA